MSLKKNITINVSEELKACKNNLHKEQKRLYKLMNKFEFRAENNVILDISFNLSKLIAWIEKLLIDIQIAKTKPKIVRLSNLHKKILIFLYNNQSKYFSIKEIEEAINQKLYGDLYSLYKRNLVDEKSEGAFHFYKISQFGIKTLKEKKLL